MYLSFIYTTETLFFLNEAYCNFEFLFETMYIVGLQDIKLLAWTKVNKGVTLTIYWIRASQQKVTLNITKEG